MYRLYNRTPNRAVRIMAITITMLNPFIRIQATNKLLFCDDSSKLIRLGRGLIVRTKKGLAQANPFLYSNLVCFNPQWLLLYVIGLMLSKRILESPKMLKTHSHCLAGPMRVR